MTGDSLGIEKRMGFSVSGQFLFWNCLDKGISAVDSYPSGKRVIFTGVS